MNDADRSLIDQLVPANQELGRLMDAHRAFEARLDELAQRRYLTDSEQLEVARLKKQKLRGKDRILSILAEHRRST